MRSEAVSKAVSSRRTHSERREIAEVRILEAALRIVSERGTAAMTLAEVGEAAGYSRGLPAHYFDSKDGLVTALAKFIVARFRLRFSEHPKPRRGLESVLHTVDLYFRSVVCDPTGSRAFQVLFAEAFSVTRKSDNVLAPLNRSSLKFFEYQLRIGIAQGEVRRDIEPALQAAIILGALRGVIAQALLDANAIDLPAIRDEMLRGLKRTLTA